MDGEHETRWTAFTGTRRLAAGTIETVALAARAAIDRDDGAAVLIFDDATGRRVDVDLHGTADEVLRRIAPPGPSARPEPAPARRGPGRPRLGVVAREVTLLPRHWEWLAGQPGGASVALRRLVEEGRRANVGADRLREAREAAYRFMVAMAGDEPGFEEATRALFAGDGARFDACVAGWPPDVREHATMLAARAFGAGTPS